MKRYELLKELAGIVTKEDLVVTSIGLNRFKLLPTLLLIAALARPDCSFSQTLEKVKVGLPDFSISFLPLQVAQSQGFFRAEGLEGELIRISIPVSIIALMNKEIDYATPT